MNHSASSMQLFDKAIASFLYFKSAEGLRDRSIDSIHRILYQCAEHLGAIQYYQAHQSGYEHPLELVAN